MPSKFSLRYGKAANSVSLNLWKEWLLSLVHKDGRYIFRVKYWIKSIPFLNFFWDLFFREDSPSYESAKSLLDVLGLINALFLTASAGMLGAVNYEELIAADKRWLPEVYDQGNQNITRYHEYWSVFYDLSPSNQLYLDFSTVLTLFFAGITAGSTFTVIC